MKQFTLKDLPVNEQFQIQIPGMLQERWNCVIKPDHDRQGKGTRAMRALPVPVGSAPGCPSAQDSTVAV